MSKTPTEIYFEYLDSKKIQEQKNKSNWYIEHWNPITKKYQDEKVSNDMILLNIKAITEDKEKENKLEYNEKRILGKRNL